MPGFATTLLGAINFGAVSTNRCSPHCHDGQHRGEWASLEKPLFGNWMSIHNTMDHKSQGASYKMNRKLPKGEQMRRIKMSDCNHAKLIAVKELAHILPNHQLLTCVVFIVQQASQANMCIKNGTIWHSPKKTGAGPTRERGLKQRAVYSLSGRNPPSRLGSKTTFASFQRRGMQPESCTCCHKASTDFPQEAKSTLTNRLCDFSK